MSRKVSWFCCDTELYDDPRLTALSGNDARWAFVVLMCLEKKSALEGQQVDLFFRQCGLNSRKELTEILAELRDVELVDEQGRPINFDLWQSKALKAERARRHREKAEKPVASCNGDVTPCNGDVTPCNGDVTPCNGDVTPCNANAITYTETYTHTPRGREAGITRKQATMAKSYLRKHGLTLAEFKLAEGIQGDLTNEHVDEIVSRYKAEPEKAEDAPKVDAAMVSQLELTLKDDGPEAAMAWIRRQASGYHGSLWKVFTQLHPDPVQREASA